jgi:hypothetical protein
VGHPSETSLDPANRVGHPSETGLNPPNRVGHPLQTSQDPPKRVEGSPSHLVSILSGFPPKTPIMSPTWLHLKRPNLPKTHVFLREIVVVIDPT